VQELSVEALMARPDGEALYKNASGPVYHFPFFDVAVDYGESGALLHNHVPKTLRLRIYNRYKVQANLALRWYTPEHWQVTPSREGCALSLPAHLGEPVEVEFQITVEQARGPLERAAIEITIAGRPTVMLVPIALLNGNLYKGAA
jgi:hypothetical protein